MSKNKKLFDLGRRLQNAQKFQLQFEQCGSFESCRSTQTYKIVQTSSSAITEFNHESWDHDVKFLSRMIDKTGWTYATSIPSFTTGTWKKKPNQAAAAKNKQTNKQIYHVLKPQLADSWLQLIAKVRGKYLSLKINPVYDPQRRESIHITVATHCSRLLSCKISFRVSR